MCGWPPPGKRKCSVPHGSRLQNVSGLFTQSGWTAGPDGVREPRPHHSSGIYVPMRRQASLGCVGSTDYAITRHYSLAMELEPFPWPALLAAVIGADQGTHVYLILSRRAHARLDLLSPRHAVDNWNPALNFPQVVSSLFGVGV